MTQLYPGWDYKEAALKVKSDLWPREKLCWEVWNNNKQIFMAGGYVSTSGQNVLLSDGEEALSRTKICDKPISAAEVPPLWNLETDVVNEDCLVVAHRMQEQGLNPAILNLANRFCAGGGYRSGALAQEETLFRATNLSQSLYPFYRKDFALESNMPYKYSAYPMDIRYGGIYSGKVTVFRDPINSYALLDETWQSSVISVAALNFNQGPELEQYGAPDGSFNAEGENIMKDKIRTIFRIGLVNGHDSLVLGAFGCGAFRLKPVLVSKLFKLILGEPEFQGKFRKIVFAILEHRVGTRGLNGKFAPFYMDFKICH